MKKIIIVFLVVLLAANGRSVNPFTCLKSYDPLVPEGGDTQIRFINKGATPLNLYWINDSGGTVLYSTLSTGQRYCQPSSTTHPWLFKTVDNEDVAIYIPLNNKVAYVEIRKCECNACALC